MTLKRSSRREPCDDWSIRSGGVTVLLTPHGEHNFDLERDSCGVEPPPNDNDGDEGGHGDNDDGGDSGECSRCGRPLWLTGADNEERLPFGLCPPCWEDFLDEGMAACREHGFEL